MKLLAIFLFFISFPIWAETDFEKAERLFQEQKYQLAKPIFERLLKANPNDYKSIEYLGDIDVYQKNWDGAAKQYKLLRDKFPKTANYHYKLGGALAMKAKSVSKLKALALVGEMETAFLAAARLDPKQIDARWALVMLYIELPGIIGGSEKKAQTYANQLMALSKVDGYLSKGYIDVYFGRYEQAETNYVRAHEIGRSKTTFQKLYDLYLTKLKDASKANKLKERFNKQNNA